MVGCSIQGCLGTHKGKGLCGFHYRKQYRFLNKQRLNEKMKAYYANLSPDKKERYLSERRDYRKKTYDTQKNTLRLKEYRKTLLGKQAVHKAIRTYEAKHRDRKNAWYQANRTIKQKQPCQNCGETNVHMHHPDPLKPLEIIFLCPLHHKQIHKNNVPSAII